MYNGIGLTTPRGTGTNGYVQRNLSHVPVKRERVEYVKDVELKRLEKLIEKKGNAEILEHERKRKIEVKCMEMREMMLNTGYDEAVTNEKVQKFRKMLIEREGFFDKADVDYDESGRPIAKETHQLAHANDEKNRKFREAFSIGEYSKKDSNKKKAEEAKEAEKKKVELANKKYTIIVDDPEPEPEIRNEPPKEKEKQKEKLDDDERGKRQRDTSSNEIEKSKDKEDRHHRHKSRDEKKRKSSPSPHEEKSNDKHSKKHRHKRSDEEREDKSRRHRRHRERSSSQE